MRADIEDEPNGVIRGKGGACPLYELGSADLHALVTQISRQNDMMEKLLERWTSAVPMRTHVMSLFIVAVSALGIVEAKTILAWLHA